MGILSTSPWQITKPFSLSTILHLETIFTLANGYIGLRGTPGFCSHIGKYGCYAAGAFNETPFFGAELANLPMPFDYQIKIDGQIVDLGETDKFIVFEDGITGIQAAKENGFFGVGIIRIGERADFEKAGADIIVNDLSEITFEELEEKITALV